MDDVLKARLIGAVVLVALAVLLIPELLSGRKAAEPAAARPEDDRSTRTFTIELGGGSTETTASPSAGEAAAPSREPSERTVEPAATADGRETVARGPKVEERVPPAVPAESQPEPAPRPDAAESKPAATVTQSDRSEAGPAATTQKPVTPEAEPPPPRAASPAATRGGWSVQVGAFGSISAANKLVSDLQSAGYRAYVSPVTRNGKTLHRVRVGPEGDRAAAEKLVDGLKARGLPTTVVAND